MCVEIGHKSDRKFLKLGLQAVFILAVFNVSIILILGGDSVSHLQILTAIIIPLLCLCGGFLFLSIYYWCASILDAILKPLKNARNTK